MARIHTLVVGRLQTNCYILESNGHAIIVDPGDEAERILRFLNDLKAKTKLIIATHTHFDHVLAADRLRRATSSKFMIHKEDLPLLQSMQERVREIMGFQVPPPSEVDAFLQEGETLELEKEQIRVIHTPGHSRGSISLSGNGYVLTGDALFNQSIGRTDLPGGNLKTLIQSIRTKLFRLDDDTIVYPGHGPETSIGDEKLTNPFVGQHAKFNV